MAWSVKSERSRMAGSLKVNSGCLGRLSESLTRRGEGLSESSAWMGKSWCCGEAFVPGASKSGQGKGGSVMYCGGSMQRMEGSRAADNSGNDVRGVLISVRD